MTATMLNQNVRDNAKALAPVGSYVYLHNAATTVETLINGAWLECNGVAVSRVTYASLFGVVATSYGVGDGSTTFNLPDFAGRVPVGLARTGGHSDATALGGSDGVALANRRPKHRHTVTPHDITSGGAVGSSDFGFGRTDGTVQAQATVGASTNDPLDAPAYLVAGIWIVKAFT